jgi:hypothetical protein
VEAPSPASAAASVPKPEGFGETVGRIWGEQKLTEKALGVVALALTLGLAWAKSRLTKARERIENLKVGFNALRSGMPERAENNYLKVCMLGLGGAGKTTLVRTMTMCPDADASVSTEDVRRFITVNEYAGPDARFGVRIDWYDYAGQNIAPLTESRRPGNANESRQDEDPAMPSYDDKPFNAAVLILDLFDPPPAGGTYQGRFPTWNAARLKKSTDQWSENALSAIKGSLGNEIKYLCVLVNKFDLLQNPDDAELAAIKKKVQPYVNRIAPLFRGAEVDFIIGSALGDARTLQIREKLIKYSRPVPKPAART